MHEVSAPPLQRRTYGPQLRKALDRIEGLVVDGLRHGFSITRSLAKSAKTAGASS
jgi:hypothetical protein